MNQDNPNNQNMMHLASKYVDRLQSCFNAEVFNSVEKLGKDLLEAWKYKNQVFICGNGGSAANAIHMANDFHYGIGACGPGPKIAGLKVDALPANTGVITCLANDTGYENIYSHQLDVKANKDDILIVLSGSGNSENIINALRMASKIKMKSHAIVAYGGGKSKHLADNVIHIELNDMQIAEDTQLIVGHICMQWLNSQKLKISGLK